MARSELRVVFTGHTGINKKAAIGRLCDYILQNDPQWQAATGETRAKRARELVGVYHVEDGPPKLDPDSGFFDLDVYDHARQVMWEKALDSALDQWKQASPRPIYSFLCLHLSFQIHSHFLTPLAWVKFSPAGSPISALIPAIKEFSPHYFVTLIDNVHQIQAEIAKRTTNNTRFYFSLLELLRWREVETMLTDILARDTVVETAFTENRELYPFEHSPQLAIRHTCRMLHAFLSEPERPRIYLSYPISKPRRISDATGSTAAIDEINDFRRSFDAQFTAFDPVTIDERPLKLLAGKPGAAPKDPRLILPPEKWWPIDHTETIKGVATSQLDLDTHEVEGVAREIKQNVSEIDLLIRNRDYRLIDQADYVVIYRPTYPEGDKREWSGGTQFEYIYARRSFEKSGGIRKRVYIIRDSKNDGPLEGPPFQMVGGHHFEGENLHEENNRRAVFSKVIADIRQHMAELKSKTYRGLGQ